MTINAREIDDDDDDDDAAQVNFGLCVLFLDLHSQKNPDERVSGVA